MGRVKNSDSPGCDAIIQMLSLFQFLVRERFLARRLC